MGLFYHSSRQIAIVFLHYADKCSSVAHHKIILYILQKIRYDKGVTSYERNSVMEKKPETSKDKQPKKKSLGSKIA